MALLALLLIGAGSAWGESVTLQYKGTTSGNFTTDNGATIVGLNATEWSVIAAKGSASNNVGYNKDGSVRLYYNSGGSNTLTVSSLTNATINTITIAYADGYGNGIVKVGDNTVTGSNGTYTINNTSFTLGNGNTSSAQVRFTSIVINYTPAAVSTELGDPVFSIADGTSVYDGTKVTVTAANSSFINYTLDGNDPDDSSTSYDDDDGIVITGAVGANITAKAIAFDEDVNASEITSATYTIKALEVPTFSMAAGNVPSGSVITITAPEGATLTYTTDGTDPIESATAEMTEGNTANVTISANTTIKAASLYNTTKLINSDVVEVAYTPITLTMDQLSSSDFTASNQTYTDFSDVKKTSDAVYAGNTNLPSAGNFDVRSNNSNSGIVSTTSGGKIKSVSAVISTSGRTIDVYASNVAYEAASDLYGDNKGTLVGSLTSASSTLVIDGDYKYVGVRSNNGTITMSSITFGWDTTVDLTKPAAPVFSVAGGTYVDTQTLTLTCEEGAVIYYTTDGTDPTNASTLYSAAINITETMTVKAIAYKDGKYSDMEAAAYTITYVPADGEYVKVTKTEDITDGYYLIVYEDGGIAFDGSRPSLDAVNNFVDVTISDSKITATRTLDASSFLINVSAGTLKSASGYYIGRNTNSNGLDNDKSTQYVNTFAITDNVAVITGAGGKTLQYNDDESNLRFRYYTAGGQKAIQLYKKTVKEIVNIDDASDYAPVAVLGADVTLTRDFVAGWNGIVLPFDLTDDVKTALGATDVKTMGTADYDAGDVTLNFVDAELPVAAGTPVLVKLSAAKSSLSVEGVAIKTTAPQTVALTAGGCTYTLKGTYSNVDEEATELYFVSGTKFYHKAAGVALTLKPFRAYIVQEANGATPARTVKFNLDDENTTGVTEIVNSKLSNSKYFDLQGRRVAQPTKGLYIVNGKKVVVK